VFQGRKLKESKNEKGKNCVPWGLGKGAYSGGGGGETSRSHQGGPEKLGGEGGALTICPI